MREGDKDNRKGLIGYVEAIKLLTPREIEVLELVANGMTNKQIASELHIAEGTVRKHRENICKKLKLKGRNSLFRWIIRNGDHFDTD